MKKLAIALAILFFAIGIWAYALLRAGQEQPAPTPGPLQAGRQKLHDQLLDSEQREADIEKQDWNSITLLRGLIDAHQRRIQKLTGNAEAGEIIAHDRDAIARLQKRIDDLAAQQSAQPAPTDAAQSSPRALPQ